MVSVRKALGAALSRQEPRMGHKMEQLNRTLIQEGSDMCTYLVSFKDLLFYPRYPRIHRQCKPFRLILTLVLPNLELPSLIPMHFAIVINDSAPDDVRSPSQLSRRESTIDHLVIIWIRVWGVGTENDLHFICAKSQDSATIPLGLPRPGGSPDLERVIT